MKYQGTELYEGLAASMWGYANNEDLGRLKDLELFRRSVERFGQPALDVGCGAGRLLLHLLRGGIDADGCDISGDMLFHCRRWLLSGGREAQLYQQAMQSLDLPRLYRTILIPCGSIMCVVERHEVMETLRRARAHLEPGGALVFNLYHPGYDLPAGHVGGLPSEWADHYQVTRQEDGAHLYVERRSLAIDPVEQTYTEQRRYRLVLQGDVLQEEVRTTMNRWYSAQEMAAMLAWSGFVNIEVQGLTSDYTPGTRPDQHEVLFFKAER